MKQIYSLLFLISFTKFNAQSLTQSFNEPVVGDIDKNYRMDTSAFTNGMPVNLTGNNCNWNFTNLKATFPVVVDSFIAPAAAVGATNFPTSTFVQHRDIYTFYKSNTSPTQTELLGGYSPSLTITFTNSAIIAGYPVSYGYNLTDPVSGSFKSSQGNGACNGNITISAGGTGTLNFPNNITIPNVLCLKSVEILTLSTGVFPFGTFNQTIYNYYMPGKKFPVLNINYTTYNVITQPSTITAFAYGSNDYFTVVGLNEKQLNKERHQVFPNPFNDQLSLKTENQAEENDYLFYDCNARLIIRTRSLANDEIAKLDPGIYFLEIKNKLGIFHQKIIKE